MASITKKNIKGNIYYYVRQEVVNDVFGRVVHKMRVKIIKKKEK